MKYVFLTLFVTIALPMTFGEAIETSLKYEFHKGEVVTITIINTGNSPHTKSYNKDEGEIIFSCKTDDIEILNNSKEAKKTMTLKSLSVKHYHGEKAVPLDDHDKQMYKDEEAKLKKAVIIMKQKENGLLTFCEGGNEGKDNTDISLSKLLFRDFKKHVAVPLPGRLVKKGDKWKNPYFKPFKENEYESGIDVDDYEYVGNEIIDGVLCAKIVGENFREKPDRKNSKKAEEKRDYTKVSELIYFDIKKGRIIKQVINKEDAFYENEKPSEGHTNTSTQVITYSYN